MLGEKQKTFIANLVTGRILKSGMFPSAPDIIAGVSALMGGKTWGLPMTTFRPAMVGCKVGGPDGHDIERTFGEIRNDLDLYYGALIDTSDSVITGYSAIQTKNDNLRRRILNILQAAEGATKVIGAGNSIVVQDTFNTSEFVDADTTTAHVDLSAGCVSLPVSTKDLIPIGSNDLRIDTETYADGVEHGSFGDTLTDAVNTGWYACLNGSTCEILMSFTDGAGNVAKREINGLYISPMGPATTEIAWTNDGYNYYPLTNGEIYQDKTWTTDSPVQAKGLRIRVTGKKVGIRRLQPLMIGYASTARVYSVPRLALDIFGSPVTVETARLEMDVDCPTGTNVKGYVAPVYADGTLGGWREANDVLWVSETRDYSAYIQPGALSVEDSLVDRKFYISWIPAGHTPLFDTGDLTKGADQFMVEYCSYDWSEEDGDRLHMPSMDDWTHLRNINTGYFQPVTYIPGPDSGQAHDCPDEDRYLSEGTMLLDMDAVFISDDYAIARGWFGVGVFKTTDGNSRRLLAKYGNYRFTTYVYMPNDTIITEQSCVLYNEGGEATPAIAPFRVYLNDEIVAEGSNSVTDVSSRAILDRSGAYSFKGGWNKLEVLVYVQEEADPGEVCGDGRVGDNVAILISPNIFKLQQDNPAIRIQANAQKMTRVSEFQLRHTVTPGDEQYWAWLDRVSGQETYGVLFNTNPVAVKTANDFDGITAPRSPSLQLTFREDDDSHPKGVAFMAELTKDPAVSHIPTLLGYRIYIN